MPDEPDSLPNHFTDLDFGLISELHAGEGANVYLWSRKGQLIGEKQSSFTHKTYKGLEIHDLYEGNDPLAQAWELALEGFPFSWVTHDENISMVNSMIPYCPIPGIKAPIIMVLTFPISEESIEWLADNGVQIYGETP